MKFGSRKGKLSCVSLAVLAMFQPVIAIAATPSNVTIAPASSGLVKQYTRDLAAEPSLSTADKIALLRQKVKYVFVLFQENRSFDHYFGTYPGAAGLYSQPELQTPGLVQQIVETDGSVKVIKSFLIPQTVTVPASGSTPAKTVPIYPADTDSVDHSQAGIDNSMENTIRGGTLNDRYALNEEGLTRVNGKILVLKTGLPPTSPPTLLQKQKGELVMGHIDCDTIPFLWQYADRFALFDNFHQTIIGPSTPNAIAMIAGQSGETQWVLHPDQANTNTSNPDVARSGGQPIVGDPGPFAGSNLDTSAVKPPYNPGDENPATPAINQTYASLPLSFMGKTIKTTVASDENPALDLVDVQDDIKQIASDKVSPVSWGWYQEGYDHEPTDTTATASHTNFIIHHEGPQYFGYIGDNPKVASNLHGLADFFSDVAAKKLPAKGGVFYVRGGYGNNDGLVPVDPNLTVRANFTGNDDHPAYSDAQISEALIADEVNAIASSPYWKDSAIIIAYDETDGLYDHVPERVRSKGPTGRDHAGGPRIPAIVISPYSAAHAIVHDYSEHSSVIKFINELFGLTPLADLPDEKKARQLGQTQFNQANLGPADDLVDDMGDLLGAFDNSRLMGQAGLLPASYAEIPKSVVLSLPHYGAAGCSTLSITPTDYVNGVLIDKAASDFNPRPSTTPGIPTSGSWTP